LGKGVRGELEAPRYRQAFQKKNHKTLKNMVKGMDCFTPHPQRICETTWHGSELAPAGKWQLLTAGMEQVQCSPGLQEKEDPKYTLQQIASSTP